MITLYSDHVFKLDSGPRISSMRYFSFVYRLVAMKLFLTDGYGLIEQWENNLFTAEPFYFLPKMMICYSYVRLGIIFYLVIRFRVL